MIIDVGNSLPIRQRFYRVSPEKQEFLEAEVKYLLNTGLAKPSYSSWASPCILVEKPDRTYRFCTDYRKLNSITKPDSFPLPRMEDCIDSMGSARFVTKIDLLKGYYQVPLTPRAQEVNPYGVTLLQCNEFRFVKRSGYLPALDESSGLRAGRVFRVFR